MDIIRLCFIVIHRIYAVDLGGFNMKIEQRIGEKIRDFRKSQKLTQEQVAFNATVDEKHYGRIERGENSPKIKVINDICSALNINLADLFLYDSISESKEKKMDYISPKISKIISHSMEQGFTIHFNSQIIYKNCENSIWYNGYIGSICFDEFEAIIYAEGNIKGQLYKNYLLMEEFNSEDIANKIRKYILSDLELYQILVNSSYGEDILKSKKGNALFVVENNWLSATICDHKTKEIIFQDIILDTDNIVEALGNTDMLTNLVF